MHDSFYNASPGQWSRGQRMESEPVPEFLRSKNVFAGYGTR